MKIASVIAVMIMIFAGSICVLAQSESECAETDSNGVYIDLTADWQSQSGMFTALGTTQNDWKCATSGDLTASITIKKDYVIDSTGENCALSFWCSKTLTGGDSIELTINIDGERTITCSHSGKIGIIVDPYGKFTSINTTFTGGKLYTNGIRIQGNMTLSGGCTVNSLCNTEIVTSNTGAIGVTVGTTLGNVNDFSGFTGTITVGTGCTLNAMADCPGSVNVMGACAGSVVITGGKANFIATGTGTNNYALYSTGNLSVTMTNDAKMSAFAIATNKNSHAIYSGGSVTLSVSDSVLYAYGTDSGINCNGNITIDSSSTGKGSDVAIYGDAPAIVQSTGTISGNLAATSHYYYTSYPVTGTPATFTDVADLMNHTDAMGIQMFNNHVVLEIPRQLYNGIVLTFDIAFYREDAATASHVLGEPSITFKGKTFDGWYAFDDLTGYKGKKSSTDSITFGDSGFYWKMSEWKNITHTVKYMSDGKEWKRYTVNEGSYTITTDAPKKSGYTFTGWMVDDGSSRIVHGGDVIDVESDTTLIAQWSEVPTFTVTYQVDGKTWKTDTTTGSYRVITDKPTKDGYDFKGWKVGDSTRTVNGGDNITVTGNTVLTAQWEKTGSSSDDNNSAIIIVCAVVAVIAVGAIGAFFFVKKP